MDRQSQMQSPWQEQESSRFSGSEQRSPEPRKIPSIARALDRHTPIATDHRLPPIATTFNAHGPQPQDYTAFADLGRVNSPQQKSLLRSPSARPEKRPRWHWSQDSTPIISARTDGQYNREDDDRDKETHATWLRPDDPHSGSRQESLCSNCADTDDLVMRLVSGLLNLEEEIRNALALSRASQKSTSTEVTRFGLRHSLTFVTRCMEANAHLVREVAATRPGQAPLAVGVANEQGPQPSNFHITTESAEHRSKRRASCLEDPILYSPLSATPNPLLNSADDISHSSPLHAVNTMKRMYHIEPPQAKATQSPRGSPPLSTIGSVQSPAQSQPSSRVLPSPSSYVPYPSSATSMPSSYGDSTLSTAQASHLQDLQHQISTKTLALQTLQREHDQLLAAFSRSQIRCSTLDKRSQVSDHEINTLSEEKVRLQQQVEALEAQVEELARAKDEAQRQLAADGAQWQRIMAMSSQLQIRSAEETRQFRTDKEAWERDRDGLQRRIQELEAGESTVAPSRPSADAMPLSSDDILASTSLETLRGEIQRLRRSCGEMESLLLEIQGETEHMLPTLATLTNVNERISALSSKPRPDTINDPISERRRNPGEAG